MTNKDVLRTAMRQSAIDSGCRPEDFAGLENVVVRSCAAPGARRYLELPFFCDLVSYGSNVVASVSPEIAVQVRAYINARTPEQCFETPDIYCLNEVLSVYGMRVRHMAEYFLPDITALRALPCRYETRLLSPAELAPYYTPQWANALCEKRRELDVLAVGAFDGQVLVGLAGCSADCDTMWQIGVDVRRTVQAAGNCQRTYQLPCRGGVAPRHCAVLLLCVGQYEVCTQCAEKRVPPCMGAADGQKRPAGRKGLVTNRYALRNHKSAPSGQAVERAHKRLCMPLERQKGMGISWSKFYTMEGPSLLWSSRCMLRHFCSRAASSVRRARWRPLPLWHPVQSG